MLVIRNNDVFPHIALRLLVRRRDFARCSGGGNDRLDRLADPDSVLVGRVRGCRHDPRRSRRMNFSPALAQVTPVSCWRPTVRPKPRRRADQPLAEHGSKSRSDQSDRKQPGERFEEEVNPETHFTGPSFK